MNLEALKQDPAVRRSASVFRSWEISQKNSTRTLGYFEMLERLLDPACTMSDIAREASISTSTMHKIYERYFRPHLGDKSWRALKKMHAKTLAGRSIAAAQNAPFADDALRLIEERAKKAGIVAAQYAVLTKGQRFYEQSQRYMLLAGVRCRVYRRFTDEPNVRFFLRATALRQEEVSVFVAGRKEAPRILVVRNEHLLAACTWTEGKSVVGIPRERVADTPPLRWNDFEEAWGELKRRDQKVAA